MTGYSELSWFDIKKHVAAGRLELFGRDTDGEKLYQESCLKIREEHGSVSTYVQKVKLASLYKEVQEFGERTVLEKPDTQDSECLSATRPRVLFDRNDFPYFLKKPIKHHLIWTLEEWNDQEAIQAFLDYHLPHHQHIFFENPVHLKSIKDIFHIHVFSLPCSEQ